MRIDSEQFLGMAEEVLSRGGEVRTRVTGGSMGASVPDGSVVCFEPIGEGRLRRGDIVLVRSARGRAVCHRVFAVLGGPERSRVQTWGDGTAAPDAPVPLTSVLGRLKSIEGPGRNPLTAAARIRALARFWWRRFRLFGRRGRPGAGPPP